MQNWTNYIKDWEILGKTNNGFDWLYCNEEFKIKKADSKNFAQAQAFASIKEDRDELKVNSN